MQQKGTQQPANSQQPTAAATGRSRQGLIVALSMMNVVVGSVGDEINTNDGVASTKESLFPGRHVVVDNLHGR